MTAVSVGSVAKTATLGANTADTVTFLPAGPTPAEIVNLDSSSMIWINPVGAATVAGTDCIPVPPNSSFMLSGVITLSVISAGAAQYCVNRVV